MKGGFIMKKIIIFITIVMGSFLINKLNKQEILIPNEAIRLRVIANSNSVSDQEIKTKVRNNLQEEIYKTLKNAKSVEETRNLLNEHITDFEKIVENTLEEVKKEETFKINYGLNYFPEKVYKGVTYEEGYYESMVVTIGMGEGDNWWCVLFPPLCLLEAEETMKKEETEYKFFVKELIDKYFKND